jgi:hypothetical protein
VWRVSNYPFFATMQTALGATGDPAHFFDPDQPAAYRRMAQVLTFPVAYIPPAAGKPLHLYPAQFDPADPARFPIPYSSGGAEG